MEIIVHKPVRRVHKKERKVPQVKEVFSYRQEELDLLFQVAERDKKIVTVLKRKSLRLYDLTFAGPGRFGGGITGSYSSWLPLAAISVCSWPSDEFADLSDYPDMVRAGDWSGIRDTCKEGIWEMFQVARKHLSCL